MNNLASLLLRIIQDEKDPETEKRAFDLYNLAAQLNYPSSITNLGLCYLKGVGVQKNLMKSLDLFNQASEVGDIEGIFYKAYFKLKEGYQLGND